MRNIINNIKYGINNLVKWFPIIWNTRDWDQYYFWTIVAFKLKNMQKALTSAESVAIHDQESINALARCAELAVRFRDELYEKEITDKHYEKYPIDFSVDITEYINRDVSDEEIMDLNSVYETVEKVYDNNMTEFGDLLRQYSRGWWN